MKKIFFSFAAFALMAGIFTLNVFAANTTVVVRSVDLEDSKVAALMNDKWFMYNDTTDTIDNSLGSFVVGPDTPVNGDGSIQFALGVNPNDRKNIATYRFRGTALAEITEMTFTVYSHSGVAGANESPYLNFNVDFDGSDSWQRRLVYVPSANGPVPQDTWNTFDVIDGGNALWTWSGYVANGNKWPDNNTNQYRTWNDILTSFSSISIRSTDSWLGIRVGEPGPTGYVGNVDSFSMGTIDGTTTFDFEPIVRDAEIISPAANENVFGMVNFEAYLVDDDADNIQWAVRKGSSCNGAANTVFGNVDGHSDVANIDKSDVTNQTFSFVGDMTGMNAGIYCFVYNPVEDSGEAPIRETVLFNLLETVGPPTDMNQCKKDGWKTFNNPSFKNQGDCVSYVQSNENAKGNKNK